MAHPTPWADAPGRCRLLALALILLLQAGCFGTIATRGGEGGDVVGRYPFQAVACDIGCLSTHAHEMADLFPLLGIISLPVDLAVDAVLSPVDLQLWPFGFDRRDRPAGGDAAHPVEPAP